MRKIILGKFKQDKIFRKRLRSSYRQAMRILRPIFGQKDGYDLVFTRNTWTYSDDGVDFYRRQNHVEFEIDERKVKFLRNLDLRNGIIRAISSEELRGKEFKNEFLMDILAIGGGFFLAKMTGEIKITDEIRKSFLEFSQDDKNYDFDKYMHGEKGVAENFLGFFGEKIISELSKTRKIIEISERDILNEIFLYCKK